ncbi:PHP domain-containing protein [Candidatus Woesearchaeota archaeon]|jgi:3',5'-nucleoside bisphosphate phosphatase|nr:PHP domain-containing protein [Candidatus Woesearchaeota archaeon]MBT6519313.1 PHP domain-containing protein [Candidatus Woesearchaeota archaeon]MBT7368966.1 PHP domain-containing protein [Candidatus Woesearchaeota archaeon]
MTENNLPEFVKANLHVHTNISDGSQTLNEYILESLMSRMEYIAPVDHDTCDSWLNLTESAGPIFEIKKNKGFVKITALGNLNQEIRTEKNSLEVLHGIELTTLLDGKKIHLVGLGIDEPAENILIRLNSINSTREVRLKELVSEINYRTDEIYAGLYLDWPEVKAVMGPSKSPSRLHVGIALQIKYPFLFKTPRAAMSACVNHNLESYAFGGDKFYSARDGINLIEKTLHGIAIIPHPDRIFENGEIGNPHDVIRKLVEYGVSGIEIQNPEFEYCLEEYHLLASIGSDSHGKFDGPGRAKMRYTTKLERSQLEKIKDKINSKK